MKRVPGEGWLGLVGGGEFSFGETQDADLRWLELAPPGPIGFLPTASGSTDYGQHFEDYIRGISDREFSVIPVFRRRDAMRGKNAARIDAVSVLYIGGGVTDHLFDTLSDTPALEAIERKLFEGGMVIAIAAAAQAVGQVARSLLKRQTCAGFGWLVAGALEPNFQAHQDRRLHELLEHPDADWGVGVPASSALFLGPNDAVETVGKVFKVDAVGDGLTEV